MDNMIRETKSRQMFGKFEGERIEGIWDTVDKKKTEKIITAVGENRYFCVGIVDIINSTKTVARIRQDKVAKYYEIFLNNMAQTIEEYHGKILKIMGDSLLFCFPDTCRSEEKLCLLNAMDCGTAMVGMHKKINQALKECALPHIDFRISFDYGSVTVMKTKNGLIDLVGPTINTCSKINDLASTNRIVIGGDLFEKIRNSQEHQFRNSGYYSTGFKQAYPVFTLCE